MTTFSWRRRLVTAVRVVAAICVLLWLPVTARAQSEAVEYYGTDALGSVRVVFDANGIIVGRMDYGPFGRELTSSTGSHDNMYAGLSASPEAALDLAEARSYQMRTGRFTSPDPVWDNLFQPQTWNRYAYARNNPMVFVDPDGLLPSQTGPCTWISTDTGGWLNCPPPADVPTFPPGYSKTMDPFDFEPGHPGRRGRPSPGRTDPTGSDNGENDTPTDPPTNPPGPPGAPPGPPGTWGWWLTAGKSFVTGFGQAQVDAWNSGYYSCIGNSMVPFQGLTGAVAAKAVEEAAVRSTESGGSWLAGAYYHFTDGRFTAWGKSSKVLVPRAAEKIAKYARGASVVGWVVTDIELFHGIYECSERLR